MDTIFALATARGKAGVAIVRVSGVAAWAAVEALCGPLPPVRRAGVRRVVHRGDVLDEAVVLRFAPGASFTGEAVAELHLHGASATIAAVLAALAQQPGLRLAEPGEFTRRALENGCLDLAQVEGLADLIDAETEAQRRQALRVLSGAIGARAEAWRRDLVRAAALVEATIDFADEDVPVDVAPEVLDLIARVRDDLVRERAAAQVSERIRDGFEVAILGAPNVGKSSLLNALAGRDAAITSEIAGTTRDVIEVRMDLRGLPVTVLDTAGLRDTEDLVERIGIERALARAECADLRVVLVSGAVPEGLDLRPDDLVVHSKGDLTGQPGAISARTGAGIGDLVEQIAARLAKKAAGAGLMTRERHRAAMATAEEALDFARDEIWRGPERSELAAARLREAVHALETLVGRVDVEDLLDEIFASFCIGK